MDSTRSVLRSASLVSIGTLLGQLIAFFGSLILVRIFSPEQMGIFTTIVAVASFIAPIASGQFEGAIPLPQASRSAINLAKMAVGGAATVSFLTGGVLLMVSSSEGERSILHRVWWWALPVLVLSLAIYTTLNRLAVRFEQYFGLALRGILYPLVMTASQILLGLASFGASGLILGMVLGHIITAFTIWIPVRKAAKDQYGNGMSSRRLAKVYRRFPLILGPAGAVNAFAMHMPQVGVTFIFGLAVGGQFGMMVKILAVPVMLVGQSIGFVYAGQIAKARREGTRNVQHFFDRLSMTLGAMALLFIVVVILFAKPVFSWLLGETWLLAGELATLFVFATAAQLVASPLSQTLVVSERSNQQLGIDLLRAACLLFTFIVLYIFETPINSVVVTISIVSMVGYIILWGLNRRAAADIKPTY